MDECSVRKQRDEASRMPKRASFVYHINVHYFCNMWPSFNVSFVLNYGMDGRGRRIAGFMSARMIVSAG